MIAILMSALNMSVYAIVPGEDSYMGQEDGYIQIDYETQTQRFIPKSEIPEFSGDSSYLASPTREGFLFVGWYPSPEFIGWPTSQENIIIAPTGYSYYACWQSEEENIPQTVKKSRNEGKKNGAGEENRTLVASLGSWSITILLRPRDDKM